MPVSVMMSDMSDPLDRPFCSVRPIGKPIGRPIGRAVCVVALVLMLSACATAPPTKPDDICSIFMEKRGWHKASVAAQERWGTPLQVPIAFVYQESAFKANARPPRTRLLGFIPWKRASSAYGYSQALNGTWMDYLRATGEYGRERNDFGDSVDFIQWYLNQAVKRGVDRNDVSSLYLFYHEGPQGYARKSYLNKPWLPKAASRVAQRSQSYGRQYAGCREDLKPGFFRRLLGW